MSNTDESCPNSCDGTATATPTGGTSPYSYSWATTGPPSDTNQTATGLCIGTYTVSVTDSNNCISLDTITINSSSLNLAMVCGHSSFIFCIISKECFTVKKPSSLSSSLDKPCGKLLF